MGAPQHHLPVLVGSPAAGPEVVAGLVAGPELAALISATGSISTPRATACSTTYLAKAIRARWLWIEVMALVIAAMPAEPPRNSATSGAQSPALL